MQLVTGLFSAIYFMVYLRLSLRVIRARGAHRTPYGYGESLELKRLVSAHSNFAAYAPFFLALALLLELSGALPMWTLLALHGVFLIGRLIHIRGLTVMENDGNFKSRVLGMQLTIGAMATAATLNVWAFFAPYLT